MSTKTRSVGPTSKVDFGLNFMTFYFSSSSTYNLVPLEHYNIKSVWVHTPFSKLSMECELRKDHNFSKYIYVAPSKNAGRKLFCFFKVHIILLSTITDIGYHHCKQPQKNFGFFSGVFKF